MLREMKVLMVFGYLFEEGVDGCNEVIHLTIKIFTNCLVELAGVLILTLI